MSSDKNNHMIKKSSFLFLCIFMLFVSLGAAFAASDDGIDCIVSDADSIDDSVSASDDEIVAIEDSQPPVNTDECEDTLELSSDDVLANQTPTSDKTGVDISISQSGKYYKGKVLTVRVVGSLDKAPVAGQGVLLKFSNGKSVTLKTDANGVATYSVPFKVGTYSAVATMVGDAFEPTQASLKNIKIVKAPVKVSISGAKTSYDSGKKLKIKVVNSKTKKPMANVKVRMKVYTGSKSKTVTLTTDKSGIARYGYSKLSIGKHKITVTNGDSKNMNMKAKSSSIKVSKAKTKVSFAKKTLTYKKDVLSITIKNAASLKAVKGLKIKVKVKNNGKYKTYGLKTNSKGVANLNTKGLSMGSHPVSVSAANKKYRVSKSAKITVVKNKAKFVVSDVSSTRDGNFTFTLKDSNGKLLANKKVSIDVKDSKNKVVRYFVTTDSNGVGTFALSKLDIGKYTFKCSLSNDKNYPDASAVSKVIIKKKSSITYTGCVHVYPGTLDMNEYTLFTIYLIDAETGEHIDGMIFIEEDTTHLGEKNQTGGIISYPIIHNPHSVSSGTQMEIYAPNNKKFTLHVSFAGNDEYAGVSGTIRV